VIQAMRQVGGTIGVAVLGTALNLGYRNTIDVSGLSAPVADAARDSAAGAVAAAHEIGSPALAESARSAFLHGMDFTLWTSAGLALIGLVLTVAFLPKHGAPVQPEPPAPREFETMPV
jgi:hypothetical protein